MKSGEKYAASGEYDKAAAFFLRVPNEYPQNGYAPKALNNAAVVYEKEKKQDEAVAAYKQLADKYPAASRGPRGALHRRPHRGEHRLLRQGRRPLRAAGGEVSAEQPRRRRAPLAPASCARASASTTAPSSTTASTPGATRTGPTPRTSLFKPPSSARIRRTGAAPRPPSPPSARSIPATARPSRRWRARPTPHLKAGNDAAAKETAAKALAAYKSHGKGSDEGSYYAAEARYIQGELAYLDYEKIKIAGKPKQLAKVLEEKAKRLEEAKSIYLDVVTYKSPEWATASLLRIGQGYEAFAKAMRNAPVPKDLKEDEKQMYRDELEKVIVVIEDKAIDAYKSGYARALQIGVYNKHTQAIRQALGRLAENEFPKEAELRLSTRPGEPRVTLDRIEEVRRDQ